MTDSAMNAATVSGPSATIFASSARPHSRRARGCEAAGHSTPEAGLSQSVGGLR